MSYNFQFQLYPELPKLIKKKLKCEFNLSINFEWNIYSLEFVIITCSHSIPFGHPAGFESSSSCSGFIQNYNKVQNK